MKTTCSAPGCDEPRAYPGTKARYCKDHSVSKVRDWQKANPEKHREQHRAWVANNPESVKASALRSTLKRVYGTTPEEVEALFEAQGRACAICGLTEPKGKGWCIDHDHETKKLRGILCSPCNTGLGMFYDDPELLIFAAGYLDQHQEKE